MCVAAMRAIITRYTAQNVIADLYAPQGVDLGEGGSLSYWCDTEWWLALAAATVKCS